MPETTFEGSVALHDATLARVSTALAALAGAFGVIALLGWALGLPSLAGAIGGQSATTPLTATMLALASIGFLLTPRFGGQRRIGQTAAALSIVIAAIVLTEYVLGADFGIDSVLFRDAVVRLAADARGRPAPNSALCLALIGLAVLTTRSAPGTTGRNRRITNGLALVASAIALASVVSASYGADAVRAVSGYRSMALGSATAITMIGVAIVLRPGEGLVATILSGNDAGAMLARRLLPAALFVPFVLGVLKRFADTHQWFEPPVGTALRTIAEISFLVSLTILTAWRARRIDQDRDRLVREERDARTEAENAQWALEEQAQELEEQAQELEATVDELRASNESLDEQRAAAEVARTSEATAKNVLEAVIDQIPVGVVLVKVPSGEVIRRNKMGADIIAAFRRAQDEALTWRRVDGTPYTPDEYPVTRAVNSAEVVNQEEMIASLQGGLKVHLSVSAAPVHEGNTTTMAVGVFTDISSRRAAESALAEREALLRGFFSAPDMMVSVVEADVSPAALARSEVDYRFLIANAQGSAVLGRREREISGWPASELGIPAERRRTFVELFAEVHRTGKPLVVERPGLPEEGERTTPAWLSIVVSPLSGSEDRLPRFCLIATDISRRRHLEEELRQAQKLEAVGRLAGGIAHDFNNLLTAITGFTRFALADLGPQQRSAREDLEQAMRATERAGALTHQLLAFSRQQVLQPQVLDLNQVVSNIEPMLRRVIGEDIAIHHSLASSLGSVRADRGQLEQVLVNLVVNARDAMPDGGLLTIETADVYLEASQVASTQGGTPGRHVMLAVTDTGMGMSADTRDRIFEPFFTTKETGRGTGLGLATVFGIVRQSGGSIWVYSEPGHGTTFKIYLPRYDGPADMVRSPTPISMPRVSGCVLLVEDDASVRMIAARVLRGDGYDVVEATTGREGVAKYASLGRRVDIILTDLVLPEMGGRAMVEALSQHGPLPPVVYMSGYTAEAMSAQSVLEPGDQFIEKPFTPDSLLAKLREAMHEALRDRRMSS